MNASKPLGTDADTAVVRILRLTCALQCFALAWSAYAGASRLSGFLLVQGQWSGEGVRTLDSLQAGALLGLGAWALVRPGSATCVGIAVLFLLDAGAQGLGHERFANLALAAHAVRYAAPLALLCWLRARPRWAEVVLRVAIASTFAAHGLEAWEQHPRFIDLLLAGEFRLREFGLGTGWGEAQARRILTGIAIQDGLLAAWVLLRPRSHLVLWMAIWGGSAALARPLQGGAALLAEAALRAANALLPLALWWSSRESRSTRAEEIAPPHPQSSS